MESIVQIISDIILKNLLSQAESYFVKIMIIDFKYMITHNSIKH